MRLPIALALALPLAACSGSWKHDDARGDDARGDANSVHVTLAPTQGNEARGELTLRPIDGGVRLEGTLSGLAPGSEHGFHVHETGDCSAPDASSAGGHYNPESVAHGNPATMPHHAGDMHNLQADGSGNARVDVLLPGVSLGGHNDISGRALVLHAGADDYTSQPSGNSGPRIACGVIGAR
jgi:Cu-Zn family superoxide dismutase